MSSLIKNTFLLAAAIGLVISAAGCQSESGTGTLLGAGIGAAIGQAVGGDTESTAIGAGVGGAVGYGVGKHQENQRKQSQTPAQQQNYSPSDSETIEKTVSFENSNGSQSSVTLRYINGKWVGPQGETYSTLPTKAQIKAAYGS
ncbi:glycine zipper domain-containing protein [Sedimentisphaera salicampi]|uniref:glycine zipper domain-containing protein n=1 Tax=Sedimentisphaera salicampi TaxID=1941349 RepID=UPI000B9B73A6|nr:glycine zipper domain-containing protein [Sedimentisphaera salicampi]OXU14583.1 Surface antigen [Sedimentisphaera salicampi]